MQDTTPTRGELVYIRSYSTRRAAIAEVLALIPDGSHTWGRVRLATPWYDWDKLPESLGTQPTTGEVLQVETYRLEPIRW